MVMRSHNKRSCSKVSKILTKIKIVFGFKSFLIRLLLSLIETIYVSVVIAHSQNLPVQILIRGESVERVVIAISQCSVYAFPDLENLRTILVVYLIA